MYCYNLLVYSALNTPIDCQLWAEFEEGKCSYHKFWLAGGGVPVSWSPQQTEVLDLAAHLKAAIGVQDIRLLLPSFLIVTYISGL